MIDPITTLKIFQEQPDPLSFKAGQAIFETGQPSDVMYGIIDGAVDLVIDGRIVETIESGKVFGVAALIEAEPRLYAAIAKTDCKLATLDQQRFFFAVQELPMFALEVMQSYAARLERMWGLPSSSQ
ncbi:cyclic nucleotide-binding domain-containing protein [Altericista sp. CCNU0014]|uniref:cyclic nucleotide-binding domain-containing protein n=1 Tax=Altericista sp. CCNU0014 TaxID=3082949 RepID=UPI00384BFA0D